MPGQVRVTVGADRDFILRIAEREPLFSREEATTVSELLHDYYSRPDHHGYYFLTAESEGKVAGFACYGPTPLTRGTYDLYWLAVGAEHKGQGFGRALLQRVEQQVIGQGGRLLVVDTSGRPEYDATRAFYERLGYRRAATVPDFYQEGDPLVLYVKPLPVGPVAAPSG